MSYKVEIIEKNPVKQLEIVNQVLKTCLVIF